MPVSIQYICWTHIYINQIKVITVLVGCWGFEPRNSPICFLFLRHILCCQIRSLLLLPSSVEKLPNVFPSPPIPDFLPSQKSSSQLFWSRSRYWIPTKLYIYLPPTHLTPVTHKLSSVLLNKLSSGILQYGYMLNLRGGRDEWIVCVGIFCLSAAPAAVCQVVLACFVNLSQKAAAKKVTNSRVYLPTLQRWYCRKYA